jgi:hypothetical protein
MLRGTVGKSAPFTRKRKLVWRSYMTNQKFIQACEEEMVSGLKSDDEIVERCMKHGLSKDDIEKLIQEHKEALGRMSGEGNPWGN